MPALISIQIRLRKYGPSMLFIEARGQRGREDWGWNIFRRQHHMIRLEAVSFASSLIRCVTHRFSIGGGGNLIAIRTPF